MLDTILRREILRRQNHETRTKRRNIPIVGIRPLAGEHDMQATQLLPLAALVAVAITILALYRSH